MRLQYLGTGAAEGMPGLFCNCPVCERARSAGGKNLKMRSCALLGQDVLLDISPDIHPAALRFGLQLHRVRHLVVTHTHADHLDTFAVMLRARDGASILPGLADADNCLHVYGGAAVGEALGAAFAAQPHANPARLRFTLVRHGEGFMAGGYRFLPLRANHKPGEECFIYAVQAGQTALLYANDTGSLPPETLAALAQSGLYFGLVSMDCARGPLPGDGHMGLAECSALRAFLLQQGLAGEDTRFCLNHLSHMAGLTHDELAETAAPLGFAVAHDGLAVAL